jgi:hypothetical protein
MIVRNVIDSKQDVKKAAMMIQYLQNLYLLTNRLQVKYGDDAVCFYLHPTVTKSQYSTHRRLPHDQRRCRCQWPNSSSDDA